MSTTARKSDALSQLATINQQLISRRQLFTDKDPSIQALLRERDALRSYNEKTAGGAIALPANDRATKESSQELVLKFRELEREAKRNNNILNNLESSLLSFQLEASRLNKPWDLISEPLLPDKPSSPRPRRSLALGLFGGFLVGSIVAIIEDRRSGFVYNYKQLIALLGVKLHAHLPVKKDVNWSSYANYLSKSVDLQTSIAIVPLGSVSEYHLQLLTDELRVSGFQRVERRSDLLEADQFDSQILIASTRSIKKQDIPETVQQLKLQHTHTLGLVWIDNY